MLFETGAMVLHGAQRRAGPLPDVADARARAITGMFAAVNAMEPPIVELAHTVLLGRGTAWSAERLGPVTDRVRDRMRTLSAYLGPDPRARVAGEANESDPLSSPPRAQGGEDVTRRAYGELMAA